jgi:hypothetical protein
MLWIWIAWILILTFGIIAFRGAPYVPSRKRYINHAFTKLYPLGKKDTLVDVGSGDGIVLRQASRYGATAVGYELNPILVVISRLLCRYDKNIRVSLKDFWIAKLPDNTTVVYAFMATPYIRKLDIKMQSEATRLDRPLKLILYGNVINERNPDATSDGYGLYTFVPLQIDKP